MRNPIVMWALVAGLSTSLISAAALAEEKAAKKVETLEITVDDLKLAVPKSWKKVKPSSSMRKGQFSIPAAEGEKDSVDYIIYQFAGGGGGVGANVRRWIGQFEEKGRVAKVTQGECPQGPYYVVDVTGTYKMPIGPPIQRKTKSLANARMLAFILGVKEKKKVYYIKTAGSGKTVNAHAAEIRATIGADPKKEKELKAKKPSPK